MYIDIVDTLVKPFRCRPLADVFVAKIKVGLPGSAKCWGQGRVLPYLGMQTRLLRWCVATRFCVMWALMRGSLCADHSNASGSQSARSGVQRNALFLPYLRDIIEHSTLHVGVQQA